tara:strand:- start:72 stop:542 length:471 start_codon:yes stop_codon:yes gene_type:complete
MLLINTKDAKLIEDFMLKGEIWDSFTDDMSDKDNYSADLGTSSAWLKVVIDEEVVGLVLIDNYNLTTLKMHPYLLKDYRKYSRKLIKRVLSIFLKTPDFINKLVVEIPFHRRIVYNLAKKVGFIDEGINRGSFLKGSVYYDQWNLGLTKKEIKGLL